MAFNKVIINQVAHYIPDIEETSSVDPIEQAIYKIDEPFQEFLEQVLNFLPNSNITYRDAYLRCFIQVLEKILKTEMFTLGEIGKLKPVVLTFLDSEEPVIEINIDLLLLQRALQIISKYKIVDFSHTEKKILIVLEDTTNDKTLDVEVNTPKIVDTAIIISSRSNPALMELMYSKGFAAHEDYMTLAECRAVTNGQIEKLLDGNETVTDFREFKYFTGITATGEYFARNAFNLKRIHLPKTLKHIEGRMFLITSAQVSAGKRGSLEEVLGVEQIESVGRTAFQGQWNLKELNFTQNLKSIGSACFTGLLRKVPKTGSIVSFGDLSNVETLETGGSHFEGQKEISTIYMPKVSVLQPDCFYQCYKLKDITLDWDNITEIPNFAFCFCFSLTNIPSMDKCTVIGEQCFEHNHSLLTVGDLKEVTIIKSYAFADDPKLTQIGRLDKCVTIEKQGFAGCNMLDNVYLPVCNSVGEDTFAVYEGQGIKRTITFGLSYEDISFNAKAFTNNMNTTIICNEVELTAEQYQAVGAIKPGE